MAARTIMYSTAGAAGVVVAGYSLCVRDRHGPFPGATSKLDLWIKPSWHHTVGVVTTTVLIDQAVQYIMSRQRSFAVSSDGDFELATALRRVREGGAPTGLICAANHATFLDAPLLATLVGRAASDKSGPLWSLDRDNWPFSVASASLLFRQWAQATFMSLVCSLPLQTKRLTRDQLQDPELFRLNQTQHIPDLIHALGPARRRTLIFFPEGRLIQDSVEKRDEEGRLVQLDGRRSEPHAPVAPFYSGIGRLVAHSGARVLPMAHVGLEPILAANDDRYKLAESKLDVNAGSDVHLHIGGVLDFRSQVEAFHAAHPHLTRFDAPNAFQAADVYCPEKVAFYRQVTDVVRDHVARCKVTATQAIAKRPN